MTTWQNFLREQGAQIDDEKDPTVLVFQKEQPTETSCTNAIAPLVHLGLIAVTGDDAAAFLHNQLTNDVEHLSASEARLAGYCSPKGRLIASMLMWKTADGVMLQLPRQIQATVQKRLQMFVLRSKAKLVDVTEDQVALGLIGHSAGTALMPWFDSLPSQIYGKVESDAGTLIRHADVFGAPRYQWLTTVEHAVKAWPILTATLQPAGPDAWRLAEIDSGVPHITSNTQEKFVPQMINFELIGGVNFKKGCYPGQEIVARSQYLGKPKRRMLPARVEAEHAQAGMDVFSVMDPEQPCGMVVNAERVCGHSAQHPIAYTTEYTTDQTRKHQFACLVEIKLTAADSEVRLGSITGPLLSFGASPYPLTDPA